MQSTTSLTLNLQLPNCAVTMYAVQNDRKTRRVQATLFDGDTAWTPPSGTLAIVRYTKPDGTQGFYDTDEGGNTAVTWVGNVATILLAEQALTVAGDVFIQVNFYNSSEERLSTFAWTIKVQKCAVTDDEIISTDYFNILSQQIAAILAVIENMPTPSTSSPLMDGTASAGSSTTYSRGDHRHPSDTSRVPTTRKINNLDLSQDRTLTASDVGASPTNHASTADTYGKGTSSNYGHVKISDSLTDTTPAATGGVVPSMKAVSDLNGAITNGTLLNGMPQTAMRIPANADMNSYTTAGTYFIYSDADAATIANTPRNASGTIYVINRANANYKAQIYIPTSSIYVYFVRNYNAGSWTNWETILNTNNNIANVEYGNSATKHYSAGEWLVLGNGSLYKAINEIQNGDQFTTGTNITSSPVTVSDLVAQLANGIEFGEWTPHIYDLNTYKRATPHTGVYFHVGKLWVLAYETYDGGTDCDLSGITTMLQIRNFPVNGINIIGGVFDIDQVATVNNHYIQAAIENRIYFRPNVLSTAFTDATNVKMSFIVFGIKP